MASAKKCDRCGKYFDKRTSITDPLTDKFNFNYICTAEEDDNAQIRRIPFKIDLCEGCLNSFVDWLKDEESHEEVFGSGEEYEEFDIACDKCKYLTTCESVRELFSLKDLETHYVRGPGTDCRKELDKGGDSNE